MVDEGTEGSDAVAPHEGDMISEEPVGDLRTRTSACKTLDNTDFRKSRLLSNKRWDKRIEAKSAASYM